MTYHVNMFNKKESVIMLLSRLHFFNFYIVFKFILVCSILDFITAVEKTSISSKSCLYLIR